MTHSHLRVTHILDGAHAEISYGLDSTVHTSLQDSRVASNVSTDASNWGTCDDDSDDSPEVIGESSSMADNESVLRLCTRKTGAKG